MTDELLLEEIAIQFYGGLCDEKDTDIEWTYAVSNAQQVLAKVKQHIEEAKKQGFDEGVGKTTDAMDSTFSAQLEEAKKQERERMYLWMTVNWTSVDGVKATYNRADIKAYLGQTPKRQ